MSVRDDAEARHTFAAFRDAHAAVLGGLGFIGSTLARWLVDHGARVIVIDVALPGSGANTFNLDGYEDQLRIVSCDIRDLPSLKLHLKQCAYVFNLAAQTSHQGSMIDPFLDLEVNARGALNVLEACRAVCPHTKIVFASTRQIYGRPRYLPVDEKHPIRPVDVNGVSKCAAEEFHRLYFEVYGLRSCTLRFTNVFGPRMRIVDGRQTFIGAWLRALVEGRPFEVWGGDQVRDFTYVDDAAEAIMLASITAGLHGRALNVGGDRPISLSALARLLIATNGTGTFEVKEFPPERKKIDIGDFYSVDAPFREISGWHPRTMLEEGLAKSIAYYRAHLPRYVGELIS
jgi:UDP-glucose 4-epimerase